MVDKIKKRRFKIDWLKVIDSLKLSKDFTYWKRGKKIKSQQRLGYMFVKHIKGREYISDIRRLRDWSDGKLIELIRIAKTPWMSDDVVVEDDDELSWDEIIKELSV